MTSIRLSDLFNSLVREDQRDFHIVHIHAITWEESRRSIFDCPKNYILQQALLNSTSVAVRLKYPIPGLDRPNNPGS